MPLVNPGGNQPVYLGAPGTPTDPMTFEVAPGPGLVPDTPFNFLTNSSGYPVRVDNTSVPAYVGTGNGTSPPEQFKAYHPGAINSTEPLQPGDTTILRNMVRHFKLQPLVACQASPVSSAADRGLSAVCDTCTKSPVTIGLL